MTRISHYPVGYPAAVTATVNLVGEYTPEITSHSAGSGADITVRLGSVMVTFMDQQATRLWGEAWNQQTRFHGHYGPVSPSEQLPERKPMTTEATIGLTIRAYGTGQAQGQNHLRYHIRNLNPLALQIGAVVWVVHDQAAYRTVGAAFIKVAKMGKLVLPLR